METMTHKIACAHCKAHHNTINEVKECSRAHNAAKVFDQVPLQGMPVPPARPASVTIRENKKRDAVKPGRYAVLIDGEWKFYKVDRPTNGRWAGYTFLWLQAGRDYWPVKNWEVRAPILDAIFKDPAQAMADYGRWIGRCGHCNRILTNAVSRAAGIGPVCAAKMGW